MIFTVEPMINLGKRHVKILTDGWTAVTKDHSLSAQWEHTVLVTDQAFEILTLRHEEANAFEHGSCRSTGT
jgi:methionyl aminopeptidase